MLYHGVTKGPIKGEPRVPFFCSPYWGVARHYSPDVVEVDFKTDNPLVLNTGSFFEAVWNASGADIEYNFHPGKTHRFAGWARALGHDVIIVTIGAFDSFNKTCWTMGDPQVIILEQGKAWLKENN